MASKTLHLHFKVESLKLVFYLFCNTYSSYLEKKNTSAVLTFISLPFLGPVDFDCKCITINVILLVFIN